MARLMSVAMTTTAVIECGCERHPAPYVYPIPHDDDATEYGAECACGWRIDGVSRETAQREADEHGGCDE